VFTLFGGLRCLAILLVDDTNDLRRAQRSQEGPRQLVNICDSQRLGTLSSTCQNVGVNADDRFQSALSAEYAEITRTVSEFDGRLITIKSWSVTLSLAGIGLGFQQQHWALFALGAATGLCFWLIEAMTKRHQVRYYPRMRQIEAWAAASAEFMPGNIQASSPRIDWAWTAAGKKDPASALRELPQEMTNEEIRRMRRQTLWLPHVFIPSALAVLAGLGLAVLAAVGVLDIPL